MARINGPSPSAIIPVIASRDPSATNGSNSPSNPPQSQGTIAPPIGLHELNIVPTKQRVAITHEGKERVQLVVHVPKGMQVNERVDASGVET